MQTFNNLKRISVILFLTWISFSCEEKQKTPPSSVKEGKHNTVATGSLCSNDRTCLEMCEEATRNNTQEDQCLEMSFPLVEGFYHALHSRLKEPVDYNSLSHVEPEDIKNIMKITPFSMIKNAQKYSKSSAMKVLSWITGDLMIASAFYDNNKDDAMEFLEELFSKINSKSRNSMSLSLDGGKNFFVQAHQSRNKIAITWAHNLFSAHCIQQAEYNYNRFDESKKKHICALGELYCQSRGDAFKDAFDSIVDRDLWLLDYIKNAKPGGLGVKESDSLDLKKVCDKYFCKDFPQTYSC